jgi:hypothetical protein
LWNISLENDSNDNFKAAFERLAANRVFSEISAAVTACLRKIYAESDAELSPDDIAKADAATKYLDDAALGRRPWPAEQERHAVQHRVYQHQVPPEADERIGGTVSITPAKVTLDLSERASRQLRME